MAVIDLLLYADDHPVGDGLEGFQQLDRRFPVDAGIQITGADPVQNIEMLGQSYGKFMSHINHITHMPGGPVDHLFEFDDQFETGAFIELHQGITGGNFFQGIEGFGEADGHLHADRLQLPVPRIQCLASFRELAGYHGAGGLHGVRVHIVLEHRALEAQVHFGQKIVLYGTPATGVVNQPASRFFRFVGRTTSFPAVKKKVALDFVVH